MKIQLHPKAEQHWQHGLWLIMTPESQAVVLLTPSAVVWHGDITSMMGGSQRLNKQTDLTGHGSIETSDKTFGNKGKKAPNLLWC